uniref:Reverse transcriptase domain-containing protein n=1 Tax=Plectus sambesii TaxID=2011161 RepID=A0A914X0W1_9BILA
MASFIEMELPDVQAGFRKGRGTRDQIANLRWIMEKTREFQKDAYMYFIDYNKAFDCIEHDKLWKLMSALEEDVRTDELAIDIVVLIVLFSSDRPNVPLEIDGATITKHSEFYSNLLLRYLQSVHGCEAERKFSSVTGALGLLRQVSQSSVTLFMGTVNPAEAEELPREFFKTAE